AYKTALATLKESGAATDAIGDVRDIGFPNSAFHTNASGSEASISMKVYGTKEDGFYSVELQKVAGKWIVINGRLVLTGGRSIAIVGHAARGGRPTAPDHSGLQLTPQVVDDSSWRDATWPEQHIRFRVPPNWINKHTDQRELDWRADEKFSSTYLTANAWIW